MTNIGKRINLIFGDIFYYFRNGFIYIRSIICVFARYSQIRKFGFITHYVIDGIFVQSSIIQSFASFCVVNLRSACRYNIFRIYFCSDSFCNIQRKSRSQNRNNIIFPQSFYFVNDARQQIAVLLNGPLAVCNKQSFFSRQLIRLKPTTRLFILRQRSIHLTYQFHRGIMRKIVASTPVPVKKIQKQLFSRLDIVVLAFRVLLNYVVYFYYPHRLSAYKRAVAIDVNFEMIVIAYLCTVVIFAFQFRLKAHELDRQ